MRGAGRGGARYRARIGWLPGRPRPRLATGQGLAGPSAHVQRGVAVTRGGTGYPCTARSRAPRARACPCASASAGLSPLRAPPAARPRAEHPPGRAPAARTCPPPLCARDPLAPCRPGPASASAPRRGRDRALCCGGRGPPAARPGRRGDDEQVPKVALQTQGLAPRRAFVPTPTSCPCPGETDPLRPRAALPTAPTPLPAPETRQILIALAAARPQPLCHPERDGLDLLTLGRVPSPLRLRWTRAHSLPVARSRTGRHPRVQGAPHYFSVPLPDPGMPPFPNPQYPGPTVTAPSASPLRSGADPGPASSGFLVPRSPCL